MEFDRQKFAEYLKIIREDLKEDWINELYSIIDKLINSQDLDKFEWVLGTEKGFNTSNFKKVVFDIVLDIASSHKSTYFEYEFDKTQKSIRSLQPKIILKRSAIESLVNKILLPQQNTNSHLKTISKKLKDSEDKITDLNNYKAELDGKVEDLQLYVKKMSEKFRNQRKFKNLPEKHELKNLVEKSRKKNGSINYSELGRKLGRTHITAKKWCEIYNII